MSVVCTLTMSNLERTPTRWTNARIWVQSEKMGKWKLKGAFHPEVQFKISTYRSGVGLFGLLYGDTSAHITITPDSEGTWTYFHLTFPGGKNNGSLYYELALQGGDGEKLIVARPTGDTCIAGEIKNVAKGTHSISHTGFDSTVTHDLSIIMRGLVIKDYVEA